MISLGAGALLADQTTVGAPPTASSLPTSGPGAVAAPGPPPQVAGPQGAPPPPIPPQVLVAPADMAPPPGRIDTRPATGVMPITLTAPLTLQQALERALEVNTTVGRARAQIGFADEQRRLLLSNLFPRVNISGATIENSQNVVLGTGADAPTILPSSDWNSRIVLSQPVYAGNRERRAYEQAKLGVDLARQGEQLTEDQVLLRVASNYFAVVDADLLIDVEQKNIALAERRRKQASEFFEAGEVTRVDVLRADTAIKAAQRALATAQQQRETAVGRLRIDLNLDGDVPVSVPGRALPPVPAESSLIEAALARRPEMDEAAANVQIAQLEVRKQRGFYLPTVTFDAGYIDQKSAFPATHYGYGAFRFNIPVFQSGEVEARIAGARQQEIEARLSLDEARLTVKEDVRKSLIDLKAAETNLTLAREQLSAAQAEYDQAFELYRAQEATSLDLAVSETSLADARRAVAEGTLSRDLTALQVWFAAGTLKQATLTESSR
jgi:outer membrane protein